MKKTPLVLFILIIFCQSCGLSEREKKLKQRQKETAQKEQQLLAWEQRLKMKEQQLDYAKKSIDSAKKQIDSANVYNPAITGKWVVKMSCIETTCEGSALGDSKTEQWEISYNKNTIIVKAYSGVVLTRVYVGTYKNNVLQILDEKPNAGASISATLNFINEEGMDGIRKILQKECKIVYALTAKKLK